MMNVLKSVTTVLVVGAILPLKVLLAVRFRLIHGSAMGTTRPNTKSNGDNKRTAMSACAY